MYSEDDNVVKKRAGLYGISVIAVSLYQKVLSPPNFLEIQPLPLLIAATSPEFLQR